MEYENTTELANREEACKRVKQIAKVIEKIKINNYLKIGGISEEDKQRLEQLESSMNIVANENGLQKLASQLSTKISERYDIESEQSETQQDEQNSIKDRLEAYRGAIDAEVQALKIGKISKAKRCQKRANMLIQQLEKDDIQRAVEYKRGVLAGLNVSLDISTEKVQVWLNRFKGCWREEDFNKRKTITQEITNITQTKTEEKSTKETSEEIKSRKEHRMKVIVGLGNPTDQYKGTRHNVGYIAIDRIAEANRININQHKFKAMVGSGFIGGSKVLLVKPLTYMNLSGESIRPILDFYKLDLSDILVIYDDISLEPGVLRLRTKGSAGGHNGMKSIIKHLGGDTFPRIRVGIGGEKHPGQDLADYVLGHFKDDEKELLSDALDKAEKAAELFAQDEFSEAMNKYSVGKKKRKTLE